MINRVMLYMRNLSSVITAFGIICVLSACSSENDKKIEILNEYEIKDSGIRSDSVSWVDDKNLVFVTFSKNKKTMYTWNTDNKNIEKYSDEIDSYICFSEGYINYRSKRNNVKTYYKRGLFSDEEEYLIDADYKNKLFNQYSCRWFEEKIDNKNEHIQYLKKEHGYLHLGHRSELDFEYPKYVRYDGKVIELPNKSYGRPPKGYFEFKKAYFFWPVSGASEKWVKICNAWWLYPDGRTEKLCVPLPEGVKGGSVLLYPVINGYLLISHDTGRGEHAGRSGIYLLDKKMKVNNQLISGIANNISISPNGCNVAFVHNPVINKNVTLKTINVCNKKQGEK
ncbi:MAG: hypothetical protein QM504_09795 [Pseudomonadota bacterium]